MFLNLATESTHQVFMPEFKHQLDRLCLKTLSAIDIPSFMKWAADDEVTKYMMWNSYTSESDARIFFTNVVEKHAWFKAICVDGNVVGSITLEKGKGAHSCRAELGYVIAREHWGNGVATKAIKLAIQTGFQELEIVRMEAYVDPSNIGSQRVLEKNSFVKEGLLRNCVIQKGVVKDRYLYSFLKTT